MAPKEKQTIEIEKTHGDPLLPFNQAVTVDCSDFLGTALIRTPSRPGLFPFSHRHGRPRVLRECLLDPTIEQILSVVRSPTAQQHARLTALVHKDFFDYCSSESHLAGYDACFFCAGPSSAGMSEESYSHVIYDMTLAAAHTLVRLNPKNLWGTRRPSTAFRRRQPQHPDASLHRSLHTPLCGIINSWTSFFSSCSAPSSLPLRCSSSQRGYAELLQDSVPAQTPMK